MVSVADFPTYHTERGEIIVESVYLSGPMSNYDEYNAPAFRAAAEDLRARGFVVHSPIEMDEAGGFEIPKGPTKAEYTDRWFRFIERDITLLTSGKVDAGVFLPEWQRSRGAKVEYYVLQSIALPTLSYPTLEVVEYRPAGRRSGTPPL